MRAAQHGDIRSQALLAVPEGSLRIDGVNNLIYHAVEIGEHRRVSEPHNPEALFVQGYLSIQISGLAEVPAVTGPSSSITRFASAQKKSAT